MTEQQPATSEAKPSQIPVSGQLLCAWPLILVFVGGALGGGLGGAAYGINTKIYKSSLPVVAKVCLNLLVGLTAVGVWLAVVVALTPQRN